MKTESKIAAARKPEVLTLFREGVFWSCYNEDAMVFTELVKPYKVMVKYIKRINAQIFVVSFPERVRERLMTACSEIRGIPECSLEEQDPGILQYMILKDGAKAGYENWYAQHIAYKQEKEREQKIAHHEVQPMHHKLVEMLRKFDLANSTPMQGMQLIQQLKQILQEL